MSVMDKIFFIALLLSVGACAASKNASDVSSAEMAQPAQPAEGSAGAAGDQPSVDAAACPPQNKICPEIFAPSYCMAKAYQDEPLAEHDIVRSWGENTCAAKQALATEACRLGKSPAALGGIECVPDVSRGKCPFKRTICKAQVAPAVCKSSRYGTQRLTAENALSASGSNECDATNNLKQMACVKNLDPEKLGGIKCAAENAGQ